MILKVPSNPNHSMNCVAKDLRGAGLLGRCFPSLWGIGCRVLLPRDVPLGRVVTARLVLARDKAVARLGEHS